jgi:hypothetical protein
MAITIDQWYIEAWARNVMLLAQQMESTLMGTVFMGDGAVPPGSEKSVDIIEPSDGEEIMGSPPRFGPTGNIATVEARRWIERRTFRWPKLVDRHDQLQTLHQLNNVYARLASAALARFKDRVVIGNAGVAVAAFTDLRGGLLGAVNQGNETKVLQAFDETNQLVVADTANLTKAKIIEARAILEANDYDSGLHGPLYFAYHATQLNALLNDPELTSQDYVSVRSLMTGQAVGGLMGFEWKRCNRLPKVGNIRRNVAWAKNALEFATWEDQLQRLTERDDLNYTPQLYLESVYGCSRGDDKLVVAIDVDESAAVGA